MKSNRKNIIIVILLLGLTFSLMNISSESGGVITSPMDDPNDTYLNLPVNPIHFTFGANIGEYVILELTKAYQTSFGGLMELGDTMNYTLIYQNLTELRFYETISHANGTVKSNSWYNLTKAEISIPYFFTTTNDTLILETFEDTYWDIDVDSTSIHFQKYAVNYTVDSSMFVDYFFDLASGWLTLLSNEEYHHNGTLLTHMELTAVNIEPPITTTTTTYTTTTYTTTTTIPETTTTIPTSTTTTPSSTTTPVSFESTTEKSEVTTTESSEESTDETNNPETSTTQPTIQITFGWSYAISLVVIGLVIFRRKRNS